MPVDSQSETLPRRLVGDEGIPRDEWIAVVERLISDAEAWVAEQNWTVHRGPKTLTEGPGESYSVPALLFQTPLGRFVIEPIARHVGGALGRLDLCAFPSYHSVMIVLTEAGWQVETNPRSVGRPWSKQTFLDVVFKLAGKA